MNLKNFLSSSLCHFIIIAVVTVNAVIMAQSNQAPHSQLFYFILNQVNLICLGVLTIETILRLQAYGKDFFKNHWYIFDAILVILSFLSMLKIFFFLQPFRILFLLRIAEFLPKIRVLLEAMLKSMDGIISSFFMLGIIYYIYAIIGMQCYGHNCPEFFGEFSLTLKALLKIMAFDDLGLVLDGTLKTSIWGWLYVISFILLTTYTFINLLVAVLVQGIDKAARIIDRQTMHSHHSFVKDEISHLKSDLLKLIQHHKIEHKK